MSTGKGAAGPPTPGPRPVLCFPPPQSSVPENSGCLASPDAFALRFSVLEPHLATSASETRHEARHPPALSRRDAATRPSGGQAAWLPARPPRRPAVCTRRLRPGRWAPPRHQGPCRGGATPRTPQAPPGCCWADMSGWWCWSFLLAWVAFVSCQPLSQQCLFHAFSMRGA